jgi:hypothetical protein
MGPRPIIPTLNTDVLRPKLIVLGFKSVLSPRPIVLSQKANEHPKPSIIRKRL